jgi:hypothetical protein
MAGWYSERLDMKVPAPVWVARYVGRTPLEVVTRIEIKKAGTSAKARTVRSKASTASSHDTLL